MVKVEGLAAAFFSILLCFFVSFCVSRNKIYLCLVFFFPFLFRFFFILVTFYLFIVCAFLQHHQPVQSVRRAVPYIRATGREFQSCFFELGVLLDGWMGRRIDGGVQMDGSLF